MKRIVLGIALLCAVAVLAARADEATPPAPTQAEPPQAQPAPVQPSCETNCGTHTVTARKVIGYEDRVVKVPIYKSYKRVVKDDCCAPPVATQPVKIPEAPPQVVEVKKKIIVREVPEVIRVPSPPIYVQETPSPRFVERPPVMVAPPPPATIHRQVVCCPPGAHTSGPPCPVNGAYTPAGSVVASNGEWGPKSPTSIACAGKPRGFPFQCGAASPTGLCICP